MERNWLTGFREGCELASRVIGEHAVAKRWQEPSVLIGLTVGGVVAHLYAAMRRFEVALDDALPATPKVLRLSQFYGLNRVDQPGDLDAGWHPLIRDDAERRASYGHQAVTQRFYDLVARLAARLPDEAPERLIPVWTVPDGTTTLAAYVATRAVELVVHADDIAASAELPSLAIPPVAADHVIEVFVELARDRTGDLGVIRAFARHERASDDALRVL